MNVTLISIGIPRNCKVFMIPKKPVTKNSTVSTQVPSKGVTTWGYGVHFTPRTCFIISIPNTRHTFQDLKNPFPRSKFGSLISIPLDIQTPGCESNWTPKNLTKNDRSPQDVFAWMSRGSLNFSCCQLVVCVLLLPPLDVFFLYSGPLLQH